MRNFYPLLVTNIHFQLLQKKGIVLCTQRLTEKIIWHVLRKTNNMPERQIKKNMIPIQKAPINCHKQAWVNWFEATFHKDLIPFFPDGKCWYLTPFWYAEDSVSKMWLQTPSDQRSKTGLYRLKYTICRPTYKLPTEWSLCWLVKKPVFCSFFSCCFT